MRMIFGSAALAVSLALAACSSGNGPDYRRTDISGDHVSTEPLNRARAIIIAVPRDGTYSHKPYPGSGQEVARRTAAAFARYAQRVEVANASLQDRRELLAAARAAHAGYLIDPAIVLWEPRATNVSLIPAQVDVDLMVIDVDTGYELRSTVLEGRSKGTVNGPNTPEEMYSGLLESHAADLYGLKTPAKQP